MRIEASVRSPRIAWTAIEGSAQRMAGPRTIGTQARAGSVARAALTVAALLIEAILILGLVVLSLGLGIEGHPGIGPDRPPPPTTPAPAPPPDPPSALALAVVADEDSSLFAGLGT